MDHLWTPWRMAYILSKKEPGCPFCAALADDRDDETFVLWRGEHCFLILNRYPYNNGHLMLLPNRHIADITELNEDERREWMHLLDAAVRALREAFNPHGFNIGINLGEAAGAGIAAHLHLHVVPRWEGDTNYMTVTAQTRTIPELLSDTWARLRPILERLLAPSTNHSATE